MNSNFFIGLAIISEKLVNHESSELAKVESEQVKISELEPQLSTEDPTLPLEEPTIQPSNKLSLLAMLSQLLLNSRLNSQWVNHTPSTNQEELLDNRSGFPTTEWEPLLIPGNMKDKLS